MARSAARATRSATGSVLSTARVAIALAAPFALAGLARAEAPAELAGCRAYRIWEFSTGAEGWRGANDTTAVKASGGVLSFRNAGADPWLQHDGRLAADASAFRFVGIRMRTSAAGQNQVYFSTSASPGFSEDKVATVGASAGSGFRFYEIDMGARPTWKGVIDSIRLDPVNGGAGNSASVEIDWIAIYQRPARLAPGFVSKFEGSLHVPVTNTGGEKARPDAAASLGDQRISLEGLEPGKTRLVVLDLPSAAKDRIVTVSEGGRRQFGIVLARDGSGGTATASDNDLLRLEIGASPTRPAELIARGAHDLGAGSFDPLASLAVQEADGSTTWYEINPDVVKQTSTSSATASASVRTSGGTVTVNWTFETPSGRKHARAAVSLKSTSRLKVLRFEGPRFLAGDGWFGSSKSHALFPGLEYLEADEPSSASWHIGDSQANRTSPHPYKITWPVMAVESPDLLTGIAWEPLQDWAATERLPAATFQSPELAANAPWHLLTLSAPSVPSFATPNSPLASQPYVLEPGREMKLSLLFFARQHEDITRVVPELAAEMKLPEPPAAAHSPEGVVGVSMRAYTQSLYHPDVKGWTNHIGLGQTPVFMNPMAGAVLFEAVRSADADLAKRCSLDIGEQVSRYVGDSLSWFDDGVKAQAKAVAAREQPDGGFGYHLDDGIRTKLKELEPQSGRKDAALGEEGKTNSGIIGREIVHLLSVAEKTGDPALVESGLRAVDRLNRFTVPRGAQTWEVHAHTPDIYASSLAVDANLSAYKLTGKEDYLKKASFWAYTGLPFIYGWEPPISKTPSGVFRYADRGEGTATTVSPASDFYENAARQINPGSTIAVFGTSFFFVNWLGQPVQWCGMAWANSVQQLMRARPDPLLARYSEMVYASATQQQLEKGFLAGLLPDSWNLESNVVNMAFIVPDSILAHAYRLLGQKRPIETDSAGVDIGGKRSILSSYALVEKADGGSWGLRAALKYLPNQEFYSCLAPSSRPSSVSVDGKALAQMADLRAAREGYFYDEANRALHIKIRPTQALVSLEAVW